MPLVEELARTGNRLFRWRSYLPLVLVALLLFSTYAYPVRRGGFGWIAACLTVSAFGLLVRALTVGQAPWGTSGRNTGGQVADKLNTRGTYSVVRHPLYLGNFFMGLGVALFPRLWWLTLIFTLAFWLYYERIMFAEEAFLRAKFADEYLSWARRTPAFIPDLSSYRPAQLPFSIRNVLRREYNGFFAVVVLLFLLDNMRTWGTTGRLVVEKEWLWGLGLAFALWLTARTVKRHTKWLNVPGR